MVNGHVTDSSSRNDRTEAEPKCQKSGNCAGVVGCYADEDYSAKRMGMY